PAGTPAPGMITLHFNNFSSETSAHYMEVYDGTSTSGVRISPAGGFTGQQIPSDIFATSGAVYIVWKSPTGVYSGDNRVHSGFEVTWSSSPAGAPGALFAASTTVANVGQAIAFTDQSSNTPTSWKWSFHDDGIIDSTAQNPSFAYPSGG